MTVLDFRRGMETLGLAQPVGTCHAWVDSAAVEVVMEEGTRSYKLTPTGVEIREHNLGAYTGEFATIIVAMLAGIAGGMLSAIGKDVWEALKGHLLKRFGDMETDRKAKEHSGQGRYRLEMVYIVSNTGGIPVVYYAPRREGALLLDFDLDALRVAEADVSMLVKAGKLKANEFLGIDLATLGRGPYFRLLKELPSGGKFIIDEIASDRAKIEALTHGLVAAHFDALGMIDAARRHYRLAIDALPLHAGFRTNLGIICARDGNLPEARKFWEEAARIDGKLDVLHYNIACFHASHNDTEATAHELNLAVEHGFRDIGMLLNDREFAPVINDQKILNIVQRVRGMLLE